MLHAYNNTSEIMGQLFITPVPILKLQNLLGKEADPTTPSPENPTPVNP